jgi:collagenase-like PrtC family protease
MGSIELLCPAGGWDALKAAVSEGADAVYFGVGDYNARRRAENFGLDTLGDVVGYCHGRGVRCHLALNTLVKNAELRGWSKTAEAAYRAGVDAVIIQDVSLIRPLKESFPDMEVHVSTQVGVFNSLWSKIVSGADRVILPRELTLNQVREFRERTGLDVEVFVQGALCFSIGGQCLMSSFLGGRSGNRGMCAQPCRKRYNGRYLLSTRDLCLASRLPQIAEAGVSSIKVEGRLRSPEYVGAAAALYRRALDSLEAGKFALDDGAMEDLELSFNREFTVGALFKEFDVVAPEESGKRGVYLGKLGPGGAVRLQARLFVGDGVGIAGGKGAHGDVVKSLILGGRGVASAEKGQTVRLSINAREGDELCLTSGPMRRKPYRLKGKAPIDLRRQDRMLRLPVPCNPIFPEARILAKVRSVEAAHEAIGAGASRAYYGVFERDYPSGDGKVSPYVPRCLVEHNASRAVSIIDSLDPGSVLCADPGVASALTGREVYLDMSCNAFNDVDVSFYNSHGMIPTVSPELTREELLQFSDRRFAVYAHGRIPLMSTKYALREGSLTDEMGYAFPVRAEADIRQVLNSVPYGLWGQVARLAQGGIVQILLDLEDDVPETVEAYRRALGGESIRRPKGYTLGRFKEGVA